MKELQIDDEFKNLIPKLTKEEFKQLEENIIEEGCRQPIIVWNNTIVDGHNRYEICNRHNIEFKTTNKYFSNKEEVKVWIIKNQFGRRNLSIYNRGKLALKLDDLFAVKAKQNQGTRTDIFQKTEKSQEQEEIIEPINTTKELANIAGVSIDTMSKIKKIEKKAPQEIKEKVKSGEMSINQAYELAKMQEDLDNYVKNNCKETTEIEEQKSIREQREKELEEIRKQNKIQQYFMKTIGDAMSLIIDNEHIEAWFSDMNMEEIQSEFTDIEKAINNLQDLKTEAKIYLNKNKLKVVK